MTGLLAVRVHLDEAATPRTKSRRRQPCSKVATAEVPRVARRADRQPIDAHWLSGTTNRWEADLVRTRGHLPRPWWVGTSSA